MKKTLANTRARFQRLSDAKLFAGWVRIFDKHTIVVLSNTTAPCKPGDQFMFQVYGPGKVVLFKAGVQAQYGHEISFSILSEMQYAPAKEEMRVLAEGTTGVLKGDGHEMEVMLIDISPKGAAVISAIFFSKETPVELLVASPAGPINLKGHVRNCREAEGMRSQYRVGIESGADD